MRDKLPACSRVLVLFWAVSVASLLESERMEDRPETMVFLNSHMNSSCSKLSSEKRLLLKVTATTKQVNSAL